MPFDDQLTGVLDDVLKSIRSHLDDDFRALAQQLSQHAAAERTQVAAAAADAATAELRQQMQQQLAQAREAAQKEIRDSLQKEIEDARRSVQQQVDEVQRLTDLRIATAREQARDAARGHASRIAEGVAALDDGRSLGDVLERLAHAAAAHVDRAAIFIVRGGSLREWRRVGFTTAAASTELGVDEAGFIGDVLSSGVTVTSAGRPVPACVGGDTGRDAAAVPVTVGGQVVAVLYCDATPAADGADQWRAMIEILARYASRVLETMTVQQAIGLRPGAGVAHG